jgi:hypothetical protein
LVEVRREYVVLAELLVGVDVIVTGGVELGGAEVGGTDEVTGGELGGIEELAGVEVGGIDELAGEDVGGGVMIPPSHKTVAFSSATSVCA